MTMQKKKPRRFNEYVTKQVRPKGLKRVENCVGETRQARGGQLDRG